MHRVLLAALAAVALAACTQLQNPSVSAAGYGDGPAQPGATLVCAFAVQSLTSSAAAAYQTVTSTAGDDQPAQQACSRLRTRTTLQQVSNPQLPAHAVCWATQGATTQRVYAGPGIAAAVAPAATGPLCSALFTTEGVSPSPSP